MNKFEFSANARDVKGSKLARRLRREDLLPAVIYGASQEPQKVSLVHQQMMHAIANEAFYSHILTVNVDGKPEKVILKAIHRHPYKPQILHMDFMRVSEKEKITMHVPLHFIGEEEAPGIKEGGILSKMITDVEIRCLPANLPEFIEVDISGLEVGHALHVLDIKLPKGVEFSHEIDEHHNIGIVSIHIPRVVEEEVVAAAEEEAAGEEVEGQETPEEGEEATKE